MKIIIDGERRSGKTILAIVLEILLKYGTSYKVTRTEENIPINAKKMHDREAKEMEDRYQAKGYFNYLDNREVEIIVRN